MSMFEALRAIPDRVREWAGQAEEQTEIAAPLTPSEDTQALLAMARASGGVERTSGTWNGVARYAASQILAAHVALETAQGEARTVLQARIRAMRDVLECDAPETKIQEFGAERPQ